MTARDRPTAAQRVASAFYSAALSMIEQGSDPAALIAGLVRAAFDLATRQGQRAKSSTARLMNSAATELQPDSNRTQRGHSTMTDQPELHMTFPLAPAVQAELAERIQAAIDRAEAAVIGCHDLGTGFCLVAHCSDRGPFMWECKGPLTEDQARRWIDSIDSDLKSPARVLM